MNKRNLLFVYVIMFCISCHSIEENTPINSDKNNNNDSGSSSTNITFNQLLDDYYEEGLLLDPLAATYAGDNRYNDKFINILSSNHRLKLQKYYTKYLEKTSHLKDDNLSKSEKISKAVLQWNGEINLTRLTFREDLFPIDQMWTVNFSIGQMASGESTQPFNTVEDYNNWLGRLDGYLEWMATAERKMEEGIRLGYVLPRSIIVKIIPQLEALAVEDVDKHLYYSPIKNFPESFSTEDKKTLSEAYTKMITGKIIPAYKRLSQYMSTTYLQAGRVSSGIGEIPNGRDYYQHQIRAYTTTHMTVDEIHQLGLSEVNRISLEMEKIKENIGFKGDIKSFFNSVRDNKELMPFTAHQQVIDNFKSIHERIKPHVEKLFDLKPKTKLDIRRTEAFREASADAEYIEGSIDGKRPGIFYMPIPDIEKYNTYLDESYFLHEAIPGHHYQLSLALERKDLPSFRKNTCNDAFVEGWALYAESLGKELGLYTDPYQYFGMLDAEMHRAIRLVVDTGIHAKGWTRERAIQYSLDNEALSEAAITSEIERYMANPGQALSYKIGQLKISALRRKAEKQLGDKFDIRQFHNQILETSCVPLVILEGVINNWIATHD